MKIYIREHENIHSKVYYDVKIVDIHYPLPTETALKRRGNIIFNSEPPAIVELHDQAFACEVEKISGWTSDELELLLTEYSVPGEK